MKFISLLCLVMFTSAAAGDSAGENPVASNMTRHRMIEESFQHVDSLHRHQSEEKSVFRAGLYSAVIPGTGQLYAGSIWKTILFAGLEVAAWTTYFVYDSKGDNEDAIMRSFADENWIERKYWSWLYYQGGQIPEIAESELYPEYDTYTDEETGTVWLAEYNSEVVSSLRFLEEALGHTHQLPETKTQQYYEMIYKYLTQFGNAWSDADFYSRYYGNTNTMTPNMLLYRDMRNQTNEYYDVARTAVNVVLLNHLISAIDAALTTRNYNKRLQIKPYVYNKRYLDERINMYGVNIAW